MESEFLSNSTEIKTLKAKNMKQIIYTIMILCILWSCTKDPIPNAYYSVPKVTTQAASSVSYTSATISLTIDSQNASEIGVLYDTTNLPNANKKNSSNLSLTSFTLTGLNYGTQYYYRAYATNTIDTVYGEINNFTTKTATAPVINSTTTPTSITQTSANSGGSISSDGGYSITAKGVCWSTKSSPTINNDRSTNGSGTSSFISSITGLQVGTTYYVIAYATNSIGTSYGNQVMFTTNPAIMATISSTTIANSITQNSANSGGSISSDGGASVTVRGVCWSSTTSTPTIINSKTSDGIGVGTFTSLITGLSSSTTYFYRAYATNSAGTSYGTTQSFLTVAITVPIISATNSISTITQTTAISGGSISGDGGSSVTARGICWSSITSSPTITLSTKTTDGTGLGSFSSSMSGLTASTTYYVRAYATNSIGTVYAAYKSFTTTTLTTPILSTTTTATNITTNSAISGGNIISDGGANITERGVCWSTSTTTPTISLSTKTSNGTGSGIFSSSITGLITKKTYYLRSYATNSVGTTYGTVISFTTI